MTRISYSETEAATRHPDVFTRAEAALFLHLDNESTLDWLREKGFLNGEQIGKTFMFHREDLEACALRMFGKPVPADARPALKIAGGRR